MSQEYNEYKWARAAAAARDVMELPGENNGHRYEPVSYTHLVTGLIKQRD